MAYKFTTHDFKDIQCCISARTNDRMIIMNTDNIAMIMMEAAIGAYPDFDPKDALKIVGTYTLTEGELIWNARLDHRVPAMRLDLMTTMHDGQVFTARCYYMLSAGGGRILNFFLEEDVTDWTET